MEAVETIQRLILESPVINGPHFQYRIVLIPREVQEEHGIDMLESMLYTVDLCLQEGMDGELYALDMFPQEPIEEIKRLR